MENTQRLRTLWRSTSVLSLQLPIKLGESEFETFAITCKRCGCDIPDERVHGRISSLIPSVVSIEAVGLCKPCLLLIPLNVRLREDGAVEFVQEGRWVRSYGAPTAFFPRMVHNALQFFKRTLWPR